MRIQKEDYSWILPLCLSAAFFFNIAIQEFFVKDKYVVIEPQPEQSVLLPSVPEAPPIIPAPQEEIAIPVPFELRGTIIGEKSLAFIYNSNTEKKSLYALNDLIEDYKLIFIGPGKAVLEKEGRIEILLLTSHRRKNVEPDIYTDENGTTVVARQHLLKQLPKANELLSQVKILPIPANEPNQLLGFRVENIPSGSIIDQVGLKSGDIIHSVDGRQLNSTKDAWQAFNAVKNLSQFEIVLFRNDQPVTLRYNIRN